MPADFSQGPRRLRVSVLLNCTSDDPCSDEENEDDGKGREDRGIVLINLRINSENRRRKWFERNA